MKHGPEEGERKMGVSYTGNQKDKGQVEEKGCGCSGDCFDYFLLVLAGGVGA